MRTIVPGYKLATWFKSLYSSFKILQMKNFLIPVFLLLVSFTLQAQNKASRANLGYLEGVVAIDVLGIQTKYKEFNDSLQDALQKKYNTKQLEEDSKYTNSSDEEIRQKAITAREQIEWISNYYNDVSFQKMEILYKPITDFRELIKTVAVENGYDLCFLYRSDGVSDMIYKDYETEQALRANIFNCAKKRGGDESEQAMQAKANECQNEILGPLLETSVDITELIAEKLGK